MKELFQLYNCSMQVDRFFCNMSEESFNKFIIKRAYIASGAVVGFGVFIGILIASFLNIMLSIEYMKSGITFAEVRLFNSKTLLKTIVLMILVLSLPVLTVLILLAYMYKILCSVIIKKTDKRFVGFLDSFDVFWSLDDNATINVLGVVESDSAEFIVESLRKKLLTIIANDSTAKMFYRRNEDYGFYYWRKYSCIDIDQYIQIYELPGKCNLNRADLEDVMAELTGHSLPYDNEGLFKVFVTKQRVGSYEEMSGDYGIIFRIHHSVGDGVALIEFLCRTLADNAHESQINVFSMPELFNDKSPWALLHMIKKLCDIPMCFADVITRKPDVNALHGPTLSGLKAFKWTESDENLLKMVKEIKNNIGNLKFSDVLAAALVNGLHNYFTKTNNYIPEEVAVVLPIRIPLSSTVNDNKLFKNNFSVATIDYPVRSGNIEKVISRHNELHESSYPLVNHYVIKLASIFPKQMLQSLLTSIQSTMVFSNMPGPDRVMMCGNTLKSLVFFVPHSGKTGTLTMFYTVSIIVGLGVTALSYGGVLRLAVMADKALLTNTEHLSYILDGMVEEIQKLHEMHVAKKYT